MSFPPSDTSHQPRIYDKTSKFEILTRSVGNSSYLSIGHLTDVSSISSSMATDGNYLKLKHNTGEEGLPVSIIYNYQGQKCISVSFAFLSVWSGDDGLIKNV